MQFKKVDVLISENLTKAQLKEKVLTELNKISKESNPSISYIANIHDIVNGKYWICMDSETKETMGATDELIDLQAIFRHTTENPDEASRDLLYSSKYIEDNFLRKIIFETYKEANDSRLNKLETTVGTNEKDIEDKHYKLEKRVSTAENTITDNKELEDTRYNEYTQFKKNIENNILSINNTLNTKANLGGSETQVFNVADPTSDWHAINLAYAKKNFNADLINKHKTDFNNPHRTTISNLNDTTISTPKANQVLVYNGTKWINKDVSLNDSNYAKKNEANVFTKKQSGIDGTEDANFVTLKQLKTKVGLTGNETIRGNKTFSSPIIIPNATANNHSLPLGQADSRYGKLLTQNLKWTVGTGGTHLTLKQALDEACKYKALPNYTITISLKSGYTVNETIKYSYVDLGFVTITSENNEEINSSVSFNFSDSAVPTIDVVFNMTEKNKVAFFKNCLNSLTITSNGGFKNLSKFSIVNSFVNINAKALTHNGNYTAYTEICRLDHVIGDFNVKLLSFDVTASGTNPYMFILRNTYIFSKFDSFISNFINGNNANIIHLINSKIFFINSNITFKGLLSNICNLINSEICLAGVTNIKSQLPQSSIIFNFIVGSKVTKLIGYETNVTITLGNSQLANISEGILDTKGNFLQQLI
ncbi:hypothetical protein vBCjeMWX1_0187 [Campylobacter phage vB_CjeM_WX1]|nr:hypothetical protein vBCjeMWX1_0187 [Campylobacter phage vB_CjeM_WX1]